MIFHADNVPKKQVGQMHALALQMITRRIISITVSNRTKIDTPNFQKEHLVVTTPMAKEGEVVLLVYMFN